MLEELDPTLAGGALAACGVDGVVVGVERLEGGVSNLTWKVELEGGLSVALRVERREGIFQPYDVRREARVLRALAATAIPVPQVLGTAGPESVLGAACIVLGWIDAPHMGEVGLTAGLVDRYREAVCAIHDLDWRAAGLGFLGAPSPGTEAARRDLDAVHDRAVHFGCERDHLIADLAAAAREHLPESPSARLCHGDINVFNYLVGEVGEIAGIVDWEQAQLGDPLSDWGLIGALGALRGQTGPPEEHPLIAPVAGRYGRGERASSDLRYWMLHQVYKLAVIHRIWSEIGDRPPWYSWADVERVGSAAVDLVER